MSRMDELTTLCRVIEAKSFSRAAETLGLTQPAVSMQIKALEEAYGAELLHRSGFEILPTEVGRLVYEYACQILRLYEESQQQVQSLSGRLAGSLWIGASSGPGEGLLPVLLGKFKQEHPAIRVGLRVGDSREILEAVFSRQLELGFVGRLRRDRHLTFEPFLNDQLVLVAPASHPWAKVRTIPYEELLTAPLILQQQGSGATSVLQDALREQGLSLRELNVVMELGLQESAKAAVQAGFGVTLISRLGVREELETGKLVEIDVEGFALRRQIYVCYNRSTPLSSLAQTFLDFANQAKGGASGG